MLRALEGFESRQATSYFSRAYDSVSGSLDSTTTGRRHGTAGAETNLTCISRALVGSVEATWIIQFAVRKRTDGAISTNAPSVIIRNSAGTQLSLVLVDAAAPDAGNFRLELRRGATVLATSEVYGWGSSPQAWHVFQLKATIHTTNGAYELRHWDYAGNQTTAINAAVGQNTANQATNGADRFSFSFGGGGVATIDLDDIVVMDGSGGVNDDFTAAPVVVLGEIPTADGAASDWTPSSGSNHADLVNDAATLPNETGEVSSSDTGDVDLYSYTTSQLALVPTGSPPVPLGVQVNTEASIKNSGTANLRVEVRDGADQVTDSNDLAFTGSAKSSLPVVFNENPTGTPAPWTMADLLSIQFGIRYNS